MSDLISRQAAIDAVNDVIADYIPNIYGRYEALPLELASAVNRLPSAQPTAEPVRHGKWIKADSQQYFRKHYPCFTCSECGYRKDSQKKWNYCPNCGADMKGAEDD